MDHEHHSSPAPSGEKKGLAKFQPLFIIVGLILLASIASGYDGIQMIWLHVMQNFMAGFFFVFAGFKLLDLKGFAEGYAKYDLLGKHVRAYGLAYPFIEVALGMGYILVPMNFTLNAITCALMIFGGVGVAIKIAKREKFQCACLGTFIDVPLTYVTLVEDFGMALMAGAMLLMSF